MQVTGGPTEVISRAILLTREGAIVLVRQVGKNWCFLPGGHVEAGENAVDALVREIAEETGVAVPAESIDRAGVVEHGYVEDGQPRHEINLVFSVMLDDAEIVSLEPHLEFVTVSRDALPALDLRPGRLKQPLLGWLDGGDTFFVTLPGSISM